MSKIGLFDKVRFIRTAPHNAFGEMKVYSIRTPEEAKFYGSFEIMCRSEKAPGLVDCREEELEVIE